jgi:hypothetical protein
MKVDIEKIKKQYALFKDVEKFLITSVAFKSLLEEVEELKEKVRRYEMMHHNTGAMFNRMTMKEKIERYEKALTYLSDCNNYMDFDFVLDHVEDVAKKALKEK